MKILEEIQSEAWFILTSIYTHQRLIEKLPQSATRYDLANQFVALNALSEILVIRIARLADKRKETRSVRLLLKRNPLIASNTDIKLAAEKFLLLAEPVVDTRHEQIAHMKPGTMSSFEPRDLPVEVLRASEALIELIDTAKGESVSYRYKVGSKEPIIDLRASLSADTIVFSK